MDSNKMKKKMLTILKKNKGLVSTSCKICNISRSAYYLWYNNDPEFKEKVDEIMDLEVENVESKLFDLIQNNNPAGIIFYLKNKSEKFKPSLKIDAEINGELKINSIFSEDLIHDDPEE